MDEPCTELASVRQEARTCPVCSTKFSTDSEFCPVCILRGAAEGESAANLEPGSEFSIISNSGSGIRLMGMFRR